MVPFDQTASDEPPPRTTAAYDQRCPYCGERIYEGDVIVKVDDEWIHLADWEDM